MLPQKTSISFDASVWELLAPLCVGMPVVLASPGEHRDSAAMVETLVRERITILQLIPSALKTLLAQPRFAECRDLRYIICGGEPLDRELAREVFKKTPWVTLGNFYGPSEASDDSTYFELRGPPEGHGTVPIGRPIANTRCYVLDSNGQSVPPGVRGELLVGGAGLARGYLNRAELTAERFVVDPFRPHERVYRTGDVARYLADGDIEYCGRNDRQVKIRGARVELDEIESVLNALPNIAQCAVVARGEDAEHTHLVSYVAGEKVDAALIRRHLALRLPDYMVPQAIVALAVLPTLPNGKVDRSALPESKSSAGPTVHVPPRSPGEQVLWEIWSDVLKRELGVHDNFFELGGHSLLATQVVSRIRRTLHVDLPLRAIFECPTIATLTKLVEAEGRARQEEDPPIEVVPRDGPLPLSFSQRRMWFVQQFEPLATAYNMPFSIRLKGPFDRDAFAYAIQSLVQRHEAFRTRFVVINAEPMQVIDPTVPVHLAEVDLSTFETSARVAEAQRLLREETTRPFDLGRGPPFRCMVIRLSEQDHVVLWLVHHAIGDHWSASVIAGELRTLYHAAIKGENASLPALPIQYGDFAVWQRNHLGGQALDKQMEYWREQLRGLPVLALPTDRLRDRQQTFRGARITSTIPAPMRTALKALSVGAGATPFMVLLACFKVLLSRYCRQCDIAVGTPIANRTRLATEQLVGTLVNTLVLRTTTEGDPTFNEYLAKVRSTALDAYAHQDLPFERLVEELAERRDGTHPPLVRVLFNVPNAPLGVIDLHGLDLERFDFDSGSTQFDLALAVDTERIGRVHLAYASDLFDASTAALMVERYLRLLEQVLADPDRRLSQLQAPERCGDPADCSRLERYHQTVPDGASG